MKFKSHCPEIKLYWSTVMLVCVYSMAASVKHTGRVECCDRDCMANEALKIFTHLVPYRKSTDLYFILLIIMRYYI